VKVLGPASGSTPEPIASPLPPTDNTETDASDGVSEVEPVVDCSVNTRKPIQFDSNFQNRKLWRVRVRKDEIAVANIWSNWSDPNPWWKVLLPSGFDKKIKGGGKVYFFPAECRNSKPVRDALRDLDSGQKRIDRIPAWYTVN
jgi:hypothetical protein